MTPPPAMVALMSVSSSSSPRMASCKCRGVMRFTLRSLEAFPASSSTSAVRYSVRSDPGAVRLLRQFCTTHEASRRARSRTQDGGAVDGCGGSHASTDDGTGLRGKMPWVSALQGPRSPPPFLRRSIRHRHFRFVFAPARRFAVSP